MKATTRLAFALVLVSVLAPSRAQAKWSKEDRLKYDAPTLNGGAGLFRTLTPSAGDPWSLRVAIHAEYFSQKQFIVANWPNCGDACPNEKDSRFQGAVTVGLTPWKYLEVYAALFSSSNINTRQHLEPTQEPAVQMALGDWLLGVKGFYPVLPALSIGGTFGVKFLNSYGDIDPNGAATNVFLHGMMTFDVRKVAKTVPLRLHLNVGYIYDASHKVLGDNPSDYTPTLDESSEKHHAFLVQQFALGLNHSRFRWSIAVDAPLPYLGGLFNPIVEYQMDVATESPSKIIEQWREFADTTQNYNVDGRIASRIVLGVRFRPIAGLIVDAGVDIAVTHQGFAHGPPLPPWNFFFQAAYAFDLAAKTKTIVKTKVEKVTKIVKPKPTEGRIAGVVKDAKTKAPLAEAIITFPGLGLTDLATAEDGSYTSYRLKKGTVKIEVRREGYKSWSGTAKVQVQKTTTVNVELVKKAPKTGQVLGTVTEKKGGTPVAATIEVDGTEKRSVKAGTDGTFQMTLKPGAYRVKATAEGYFTRYNAFVVNAGTKQSLEFKLTKRPKRSVVVVQRRKLRIRKKIHFAYNKATIRPDSLQILDEVAEVMNEHPDITRLRVEGHTDRRGGWNHNLKLSQRRAEAVRDYLIAQGVDPARLEAVGYGYKRPLVPELTPRHRAINRRVEFRILKRAGGFKRHRRRRRHR